MESLALVPHPPSRPLTSRATHDVMFLQQRVAKLKADEVKVWKQLDQVREQKRKAEERAAQRVAEHSAREALKRAAELREHRHRELLQSRRDAERHALFLSRSQLALQRRQQSNSLRSESNYLLNLYHENTTSVAQRIRQRHQLVMDMKRRAHDAFEAHREEKSLRAKEELLREAQLAEEEDERNVARAAALLTLEAQIVHRIDQVRRETASLSPRRPSPVKLLQ